MAVSRKVGRPLPSPERWARDRDRHPEGVFMSIAITRTPEETEAVGESLGRTLGPGDVVALCGELGSGKTCFVRGVARALGVRGRPLSPTFTLINEYRGTRPVYHVDAYRLESLAEMAGLGLEEEFDGEGVTLVERAVKVRGLLPARALCVRIEGVGDEPRTITIRRGPGEISEESAGGV